MRVREFSMDSAGQWLGVIGGVAGIIVLLTSAWVFMRGSYSKARIEELSRANRDLRDRVGDLEGERKADKAQIDNLDRKVGELSNENRLLADMVTQRAAVEKLSDLLNVHHEESMTAWSDIKDLLEARAS
jgi:predicted nuclease with TOPRIM domain